MKYCLSSQFGFRNKHSTTDALRKFIGDVLECFDKNMICFSVFIDLKKAFDTVNHDIILDKLQYYGATDMTLNWYKSYLSNSKQRVVIDDQIRHKKNCIQVYTKVVC